MSTEFFLVFLNTIIVKLRVFFQTRIRQIKKNVYTIELL